VRQVRFKPHSENCIKSFIFDEVPDKNKLAPFYGPRCTFPNSALVSVNCNASITADTQVNRLTELGKCAGIKTYVEKLLHITSQKLATMLASI